MIPIPSRGVQAGPFVAGSVATPAEASTLAANQVLACQDLARRWIAESTGSVQASVPNLANLTALEATTLPPGSRAVVQSLRRVAVLQTSSLALSTNEVVASSDPTK